MTRHEFTVQMTCEGCKKSVNAVLTKTPGVEKVDIDLAAQTVVVEGTATQEECLKSIQKTGKKVSAKS